ncbi:MAG: hypothetical protein KZQ76_10440 [Candidatus Thiodiazotropha sp. (ex Epidulcina cf. delphinae)]|nr:hypothetical protein [Candidatus Thiodiazotropha sp. (ex Epidulcina cf. delphinae)]
MSQAQGCAGATLALPPPASAHFTPSNGSFQVEKSRKIDESAIEEFDIPNKEREKTVDRGDWGNIKQALFGFLRQTIDAATSGAR